MSKQQDQVISPWTATTTTGSVNFDYMAIQDQFGLTPITDELLERFVRVTGKEPHIWLKRGLFMWHRDLDLILDDVEQGKQIFIYTGRGPTSDALHLGHMIPFMFTKWLQDVFNCIVVIQISDTEKFYFKNYSFDEIGQMMLNNVKDIIACGFNPETTFIYSDHIYCSNPEPKQLLCEMFKKIPAKRIQDIFGITVNHCIGCYIWPIHQMAGSLCRYYGPILNNKDKDKDKPVRCLVAYAVDQDPYFRGVRDIATNLGCLKPASIISKFLPALEGGAKMSSTVSIDNAHRPIFMNLESKDIINIIKKKAFSGCKQTLEEHRKYGANLDIDMSYQYLLYFLEDDAELLRIGTEYKQGIMTASQVKTILSNLLVRFVEEHKARRANVTDEVVKHFYDISRFC